MTGRKRSFLSLIFAFCMLIAGCSYLEKDDRDRNASRSGKGNVAGVDSKESS